VWSGTIEEVQASLLIAIAAAFLLHVYTLGFKAEGGWSWFMVGLLLFSLLPYAIAAKMSRFARLAGSAVGFAVGALIGDLFMHYQVFMVPNGSSAALGLLIMPFWNLLILCPIGALVGWAIARFLR
jgi:hypothetical protein